MKDFSELKEEIIEVIRANGRGEITGQLLQDRLLAMCDNMEISSFEGFATPSTNPTTDYMGEHFYFAMQPGDYSAFVDNLTIEDGDFYLIYKLANATSWSVINLREYMKGEKGDDGADGTLLFPSVGIDSVGRLYVEVPEGNESNLTLEGENLCVIYPDVN